MSQSVKRNNLPKRLGYPLWFRIIFFALTVLGPIGVVMSQGFQTGNTTFHVGFGLLSAATIAWLFIHRFVIKDVIVKLKAQEATLDLNYRTGVGDRRKTAEMWAGVQFKQVMFDIVSVLLLGGLLMLILYGIATALMSVHTIVLLIGVFYVAAYVFKLIYLLTMLGLDEDLEGGTDGENDQSTAENQQ